MVCLDGETGKVIWSRHMTEEFGVISTFGGRTPSPALDGDQIFLAMVAFGWGDQAQGQHRLFALNKETGELNWSAGTGGRPVDAPYNTPVIANINGVRQVMFGAGDGGVHSFQARTGKHIWSFQASKRGLNSSVVMEGERVFVTHSEENLDTQVMGRVVCLDVSGEAPKEVWRTDGIEAGFASPTLGNGMLYVMDNGGAVHALDVSTGKSQWKKRIDSIGKASLVFADGKLYVPGANGNFLIMRPGAKKAEVLSKVEITEKLGREYTIFGSVAVSDGKVFLQTANKMYCIGDKNAGAVSADPIPEKAAEDVAGKEAAWVQVVPSDVLLRPGEKATFSIRTFDAKGVPVTVTGEPKWNIDQLVIPPPPTAPKGTEGTKAGNLKGQVSDKGVFTAAEGPFQGGAVTATIEVNGKPVVGHARVRVLPNLPWTIDLTKAPAGKPPLTWIGAGGKFAVRETDGAPALLKLSDIDLYHAARTYFGERDMTNYTVEADIKVGEKMLGESRQMPDAGVINSKYALVLLGNHQRCQINVWSGALPTEKSWAGSLNKTIDFKWAPNKWYRYKLRVEPAVTTGGSGGTLVRGKVWKKGDAEPEGWTVELTDTIGGRHGSPGLFAESLVTPAKSDVFFDNIAVTPNK
jgi:outer membrane protein assembly factor BamB